jgi:hypothetical protein
MYTCCPLPAHRHGPAMAQVVNRLPLTSKVYVRSKASTCPICGGGSGAETGFRPNKFSVKINSSTE